MHEDLFPYYENELLFLRQSGSEFADKYPAEAGALKLEKDRCPDPHVERVLEAFALLSGRIRKKLDDEFPELTNSMLEMLAPHMVAPIPPVGIVQFQVDPQSVKLTSNYTIPRETKLFSMPVGGIPCQFKTVYPVELLPLQVESAEIGRVNGVFPYEEQCGMPSQAELNLTFKSIGGIDLGTYNPKKIRLYLHGMPLSMRLYELFSENVLCVEAIGQGMTGEKRAFLNASNLIPAGFDREDSFLPTKSQSFEGYRLLHEFFAFQEKFMFFDIMTENLFEKLAGCTSVNFKFYLKKMPEFIGDQVISKDNFLLGCTPVINLFTKKGEPFKTNAARREYLIVPELSRDKSYEVYNIDEVNITDMHNNRSYKVEPFYSFNHTIDPEESLYWYSRKDLNNDGAIDHYLNFCSLGFEPKSLLDSAVSVDLTCSNRDLVRKMIRFDGRKSDFTAEDIPTFGNICAITLQTEAIRTPLGRDDEFWNGSDNRRQWRGGYWRLISHLSLNFLSLQEGNGEALRALLQIYDIKGLAQHENMILGIIDIKTKPMGALVNGAYCRGLDIILAVNPEKFSGSSYMLVTAILDRFFARYATINSLIRLTVTDDTEKRNKLKQWPIRAGEQQIL